MSIIGVAIIFPLNDTLKEALPNAAFYFCVAIAVLFIMMALVYDLCCWVNKINPYQLFKIAKSNSKSE